MAKLFADAELLAFGIWEVEVLAFDVGEDEVGVLFEGGAVACGAAVLGSRSGEVENVDDGEGAEHLVAEVGVLDFEEVVGVRRQGVGEVVVDAFGFEECVFAFDDEEFVGGLPGAGGRSRGGFFDEEVLFVSDGVGVGVEWVGCDGLIAWLLEYLYGLGDVGGEGHVVDAAQVVGVEAVETVDDDIAWLWGAEEEVGEVDVFVVKVIEFVDYFFFHMNGV